MVAIRAAILKLYLTEMFFYHSMQQKGTSNLLHFLMMQEFLALPRADAIHLLAQYNGNAETVIQQIFA